MASGPSRYIINEQILAEWEDVETGARRMLGTCSHFNSQKTDLTLKVSIDQEENAHIYIDLIIDACVSTKKRKKVIRLVFLPHLFNKNLKSPLAYESLQITNLDSSSILQQADLTNLKRVIRVEFNLASQGCVVVRKSDKSIKPATYTSINYIEYFKSLSTMLKFNVYMRQSDYAECGLRQLNQKFQASIKGPSTVNLIGIFETRDGMFLDWDSVKSKDKHKASRGKLPPRPQSPPPSYINGSSAPPVGVQVHQAIIGPQQPPPFYVKESSTSTVLVQVPLSPPKPESGQGLQYETESVLAETPFSTSNHDSPIAPTVSQTSDHCIVDIGAEFERIENEIGPDDEYFAALQAREASLDREAAAFIVREGFENVRDGLENDISPDEENYAREVSLAREFSSTSDALLSEMVVWVSGAMMIHQNVYKHSRLNSRISALGNYARLQNIEAFVSTMIWCSAILFYDPLDSGTTQLWSVTNRWLISDIADMIQWSNTFRRSVEMSLTPIRSEFLKLGSAARAVALLANDSNLEKHRYQRAYCVAFVSRELGSPSFSGGK